MTTEPIREQLRALVASKRRWAEQIAKVCMAESNQFRAGDIIAFCDELEALLGAMPPAATNDIGRDPIREKVIPHPADAQGEAGEPRDD
jgi:hypothetical protein